MIDVEAIKRKAGKNWSFDELEAVFGEQYKPGKLEQWVGLARAYTPDDEIAKDAVQEALIKTAANIDAYDPNKYHGQKCPFENWLGQRIIWEAKMAWRNATQQHKVQEALSNRYPSVGMHNDTELHGPVFPVLSEEFAWQEIKPLVAKLDEPDLAEAVELCARQNFSHDEAARKSKWPCNAGAMKVRLCRARHKLRTLRSEMGYEP